MQLVKPFEDYTEKEKQAIYQTLEPLLKSKDDWHRSILQQITMVIGDLCEGNSHPDTLMYEGEIKRRVAVLLKAYEQLGERLQWELDDRTGRRLPLVLDTLVSELTGEPLKFTCAPISPQQWVMFFGENPDQHIDVPATSPMETPRPRHLYVQPNGRPKNHVMRLAVDQLMDIFEMATGIKPVIYSSPQSDNAQYAGNFYEFAVACLAPVFPDSAAQLGSAICSVYQEILKSRLLLKLKASRQR